jgi:D-alanine transaminase
MKPLGLLDGRIIDLNENILPMEDRGYQFGDGVYEYTKVYNGHCFAFKQHMDRLYRSLRELRIPAVYTLDELAEFHQLLIKESGITDGGIYLQITRGVAPRVHSFPDVMVPKLTMSIRPAGTANYKLWETGAKIITIPDERWMRCDIKSLNLLGNILGKQRAKETGCFEAVMVRDGFVTEGTSSNFFVVKDGVLWTHPSNNLILKGITKTLVIENIASQLELAVVEKKFDTDFVMSAQEAFLTGTSTEIMPIVSINGHVVSDGQPGNITLKIQKAYQNMIDNECGR